jgi:8-oxo-dGTP pyrophosphatase MutT (NUDIX family)
VLSLADVEVVVHAHEPHTPTLFAGRRAAVAMLLRDGPGGPEVLLMKRREHERDRWSGHVSLPGGKEHAGDADLVATAVRETAEEVGIDLVRDARLVGRLDAIRAIAEGKLLPMTITPFVFLAVGATVPALREEAESVFWLPLAGAASGALDAVYLYRLGPLPLRLPCWRFEGYVVWGLTYQMLRGLIELVTARTAPGPR